VEPRANLTLLGLAARSTFVEQGLFRAGQRALGVRPQRAEVQTGRGESAGHAQRQRHVAAKPLPKQL